MEIVAGFEEGVEDEGGLGAGVVGVGPGVGGGFPVVVVLEGEEVVGGFLHGGGDLRVGGGGRGFWVGIGEQGEARRRRERNDE